MAALMTLSQLSSGNPVYESYYRQLDPVNSGKVSASDAAQFLKKSGLSGSTLGKALMSPSKVEAQIKKETNFFYIDEEITLIWDLADSERKGYLDKRGFFIALRLVASAQGGNDISLNNLNKTLAAPKFRDTSSPLMGISTAATDPHWAIRPDEKGIFEAIFESLSPVNGLLPGEKVRPVLINSKLPMDVLGKIWELSDVDKDGQLDKEEFTVVMHLVYRAIDKEPVPATLPPSLIPPSKRKKSAVTLPGAVAVLPTLFGLGAGSSPLKETLRSTPPLINSSPLINTTPLSTAPSINLSPKHSFKSSKPVADNWVVPATDRDRYDDIFKKMDTDNDGLVTGGEVIEIFMQSTLSQTMLAQIWGLADTKQTGKLNREQFSLAMYLIQQKVSKGVDPPSILTPDMIPPSERSSMSASLVGLKSAAARPAVGKIRDSSGSAGSAELTGIKELDDLSQEIAQLQREKFILEHEIREKEEAIRQQNSEVQEMQNDLDRESSSLQDLDAQKQDAQERLEEMDQQRSRLEGMVNDMKQKCQEESQKISSLQSQIRSQESTLRSQEDEASRTKTDLSRLQDEEAQLEQSLLTGRVQLDSIIKSLKTTQDEIGQARSKLSLIQENQREVTKTIEQYNSAINEVNGGNLSNLSDTSDSFPERESGAVRRVDESFKSRLAMFNNNSIPGSTGSTGSSTKERQGDPFQSEDPFKSDIFKDPFGSDPFKQSDPFKGTSSEDFFKRTDKADLFASSEPFSRRPTPPAKPGAFNSGDPFSSSNLKSKDSDPFGSNSYGGKGGFADFSQMSKKPDPPGLPSKKNIPNRPAPPYGGLLSLSGSESLPATGSSAISNDSFVPTHSSQTTKDCAVGLADLGSFGNETQQLEWAKRESQREEDERLRRMRLQEQQDLELAIALSKADLPGS